MNNGLRYVNISCNLVDKEKNLYNGATSGVITSLLVGVIEKGKVQTFHMESRVPIRKGHYYEIRFSVTDQDGKPVNVGKILMELYVA